jgi:opacity protein-like surface antigen
LLANGASYTVDGEKLNRLGFELGAKVTTKATEKVEVSAGYLTRIREDYQDHTLTVDAKYNF